MCGPQHAGDPRELDAVLQQALRHDGPALVDIVTQPLELAAAPVFYADGAHDDWARPAPETRYL